MMRKVPQLILSIAVILNLASAIGAETEPVSKQGVEVLQLVTESESVQPGGTVQLGLYIRHTPGYHTYWKNPGIVGVPTSIKWMLPEGWEVGEMVWPLPELTKMAQYTAYGYERDVCLITPISVPEDFQADRVTLRARVSFMCCAKNCHPGWHDFELNLPVSPETPEEDRKWSRIFDATRDNQPLDLPGDWQVSVFSDYDKYSIQISPGQERLQTETEGVYFFCENKMVDSDEEQWAEVSSKRDNLQMIVKKSEFAPQAETHLRGLAFHPEGWPGLDTKWLRIDSPIGKAPSDE